MGGKIWGPQREQLEMLPHAFFSKGTCGSQCDTALASDIMRATDNAVFAEIQAWQAVFSGKNIAVPA